MFFYAQFATYGISGKRTQDDFASITTAHREGLASQT